MATTATATKRPKATTAPRQLLSREERQAQILQAAASAFAGAGFAATSMEDVAAEAGVTKLIVYRHFESKEELYRAVLTQVADRMHDEFVKGLAMTKVERGAFATRAILSVAREQPDAFRLLTLHAAREPQFADFAMSFRERGIALTDLLIGDSITDPTMKAWAIRVIVDYLVNGVHAWVAVGDPARDEEFVTRATDGLKGMMVLWVDRDLLPDSVRRTIRAIEDLGAASD